MYEGGRVHGECKRRERAFCFALRSTRIAHQDACFCDLESRDQRREDVVLLHLQHNCLPKLEGVVLLA